MEERQVAAAFKALGDENRIRILRILRSGESCACHLLKELSISQPTLSHHMKILCDAGIVTARKEGKWIYYSICCDGARKVRELLQHLLSPEHVPANCCKEE